jgi:tellurite resistance protein TehA-like permease
VYIHPPPVHKEPLHLHWFMFIFPVTHSVKGLHSSTQLHKFRVLGVILHTSFSCTLVCDLWML